MAATAVRVGLRVRPLTQKEQLGNCTECLSYVPNEPQILIGTDKSFTYDYVFDNNTTQKSVYSTAVVPLLSKFNATILAYGQTGSGKTYSMGTGLHNGITPEDQGIVPRCIVELFQTMEERGRESPDFKYDIYVSFLELYNEELVDLLNPHTIQQRKKGASGAAPVAEVTIREDITGNIYWSGVREERCNSPDELLGFLAKGSLCRTTGSTDMNTVSSRSHAIFSVILKQQRRDPNAQPNHDKAEIQSLTSKFHFVDLAGSERLKRTNAQGDRAKEGIAINSGLLALGNVISALGDETRRATHIPYRDSKLTRLLQDSLGGNSQTMMLACVSPADSNFMETLNTLKYANRARNIKNRVTINQDFAGNSIEINQLRACIARLRMEVASLRAGGESGVSESDENKALRAEVVRLRDRVQDMSTNLIQVTSERDTLIMERELGMLMTENRANPLPSSASSDGLPKEISTHPLIVQYQHTIQDLNNELQDTRDRLAFLENTQPVAMQAMMMASSSFHKNTATLRMSSSNTTQHSVGGTRRKVKKRYHNARMTSSNSGRTSRKHSARRPHGTPSSSFRTRAARHQLEEFFEIEIPKSDDQVRQEVKESIAKARAEIQKGMHVLDLAKPLEDAARDWEEELREFEEHERMMGKDIQRTSSDEGNYTPSRSPVDQDLLSNDLLDEIENLAVPSWDDPDTKPTVSHSDAHTDNSSNSSGGSNTSHRTGSLATPFMKENMEKIQNPQLIAMLHQIQSDIRVKEELVAHLEKSETEYAFMRRKFDDKIAQLQHQLLTLQRERNNAIEHTRSRMSSKSEMTVQMREKQHLIDIRHAYEAKMKNLLSEIQELKRKYAKTTMTMQSTRNQHETLLRSLRVNVETLKVEKKRMIKRMKLEAERVREQSTLQERKIQQLQRLNTESNMARKRLEREREQQKLALKQRDKEVLMNNQQLKQLIGVLKKAVREGGVLDEDLLGKVSHIVGGNFALVARRAAGRPVDQRAIRRRINKIPTQIRVTRKKELLDNALYQYIQGKQAIVEMEQLLFRREQLASEKLELIEERRHIYIAEKENEQATGQPMDMLALNFTDERIDLISAEISYLSARIRALQTEAMASEESESGTNSTVGIASVNQQHQHQRLEKRVTFADDIITDPSAIQSGDGWTDMDILDEQYSVSPSAAPEIAYDAVAIAEALIEDVMALRMSETNRQVIMQNLEKTVHDLRRTLVVMKRAAISTTVENERRIRKLEERSSRTSSKGAHNDDEDSAIDVKIEEYINSGNTIFDKIYEDGIRGVVHVHEPTALDYLNDSRRSSITSFGAGSMNASDDTLIPPPSPLNSPTYIAGSRGHNGVRPPASLTDKGNRHVREGTPSPERFLNMVQRRFSWQQRLVNGTDSPVPYVAGDIARHHAERETSTTSIRSNHIRRSSVQSDYSTHSYTGGNNTPSQLQQHHHNTNQHLAGALRKRAYSLQQPLAAPNRRRTSMRELSLMGYEGEHQQQQQQQYYYEPQSPTTTLSYQQRYQQQQMAPPRAPPLGPVPSASSTMERSSSAGNVFDRLSQTPTRASRAKMAHRFSSGSIEELRQQWEYERSSSALSGTYQL
ncbi:hypothetical protein BX666DRAFT_2026500 [Dichotomocladium elegans]|nr:hypothetical protein BX666DRAFT_2026500 [Dichotomocladium elegans]